MWGYGPHWDMMGWGGGSWLGPFGMFFWFRRFKSEVQQGSIDGMAE
jgi:hypothetical protein